MKRQQFMWMVVPGNRMREQEDWGRERQDHADCVLELVTTLGNMACSCRGPCEESCGTHFSTRSPLYLTYIAIGRHRQFILTAVQCPTVRLYQNLFFQWYIFGLCSVSHYYKQYSNKHPSVSVSWCVSKSFLQDICPEVKPLSEVSINTRIFSLFHYCHMTLPSSWANWEPHHGCPVCTSSSIFSSVTLLNLCKSDGYECILQYHHNFHVSDY